MRVTHTALDNMTALQRQLQAAKKTNNGAVRTRLPLTHTELMSMKPFIGADRDGAMIWAAMTVAVAGLLRSGEFTSQSVLKPITDSTYPLHTITHAYACAHICRCIQHIIDCIILQLIEKNQSHSYLQYYEKLEESALLL